MGTDSTLADCRLTEVTVTGVPALCAGPAGGATGCAGPGVKVAGLGDGGDKVFVLGVSPAPPADLWLAAACDDRPVTLVPAGRPEHPLAREHLCVGHRHAIREAADAVPTPTDTASPVDHDRDPLPGSE